MAEIEQQVLKDLLLVEKIIREKEKSCHPGSFGLPDLLFPQNYKPGIFISETQKKLPDNVIVFNDGWAREKLDYEESDDAYWERQKKVVESFVRSLFIIKDGRKINIGTIPQMIDFIASVFYTKHRKVILWKPRGGGGSFSAAVLIFMLAVYKKLGIINLAGSQEQSKVIYHYVVDLFSCFPGLKDNIVEGEPRQTSTDLLNGGFIKCISSSEKQVRGKHASVLVADEACQTSGSEAPLRAALQSVMSEAEPIVVLLSTFHVPIGLFQEYWDEADKKGFTRIKWTIFDVMEKCQRGIESATPEDPLVLEYCKTCPLTYPKTIVNETGEIETTTLSGCMGKARKSCGWMSFENVLEARKINLGTDIFEVEFACERPGFQHSIYPSELIDLALCEEQVFNPAQEKVCVGIDWGLETENSMCMVLGIRRFDYVYIHEALFMDHKLVSDIARILYSWQNVLGRLTIVSDASHPFNNAELVNAGYDVRPVTFGTFKKFGIQNVLKYFTFRRLKINKKCSLLIEQLKRYRKKDALGSILKKDDHGCDALLCVLLNWRFEEEFGDDIARADIKNVNPLNTQAKNNPVFDGIVVPRVMPFVGAGVGSVKNTKDVLVF